MRVTSEFVDWAEMPCNPESPMCVDVLGSCKHWNALEDTRDMEAPEFSNAQATSWLPEGPSRIVIMRLCGTIGASVETETWADTYSADGCSPQETDNLA